MKLAQPSIEIIQAAILKAVESYKNESNPTVVTDIHLQADSNTGQLTLFNDDDQVLATANIEEWVSYNEDKFMENVETLLRNLLEKMKEAGSFDQVTILKPYSFVLVDEDKETIAELLLMDDDTLLLSEELLKGLDEELDDFLKELLEK